MISICISIFCVFKKYFDHWKDYSCYMEHLRFSFFFPSLFPFLSLPIDSEKNDRWRKWRKNVWNTGQVPRWGKIGTQRVTFTGIKQTRKIMWNGEMMGCSFCNDNLYHFFPLDLLVLLAYIKKKYVLRKKKIVLFLGFFGASLIRQLLMRSYTLFNRKWTQPTSVQEFQNKVLNLLVEMCGDGFGSLYCGWMGRKL